MTVTAFPTNPYRPAAARRTAVRAVGKLMRTELKLFLREPISAFFSVIFPAVLIVVLGGALPGFLDPNDDLDGRRPIDIYLPITLALAIATVALVSLLTNLTAAREKGLLRRLSTTPASPVMLLVAQLAVNLLALVAGSVLAVTAAWIAFDVRLPENAPGLVVAFTLGSIAMVAVALLIAAVTPNSRASMGVGSLVYYPMMFAAGVWTPGPAMPDVVRRVADYTPLGAASQAMQDAWAGDWPRLLHLVVLVGYTVVLGGLAARLFRWS